MTPETFAELRRLAEAATPGPWSYFGPDQHGCDPCIESSDHYVTDLHATDEDAAYIVAANPAVVLALHDAAAERDALAAERDALAAKVERVRALHTPTPFWALTPEGYAPDKEVVPPDGVMCLDCSDDHVTDDFENCGGIVYYPCPTIRALDEEAQP